jgi:quercetin dioxygenase-like cupin family protein
VTAGSEPAALVPVLWDRHRVDAPVAGVLAWQVETPRITLALYELEAGVDVPEHVHEGDEVGVVISGRIVVTVDGESRTLAEGETFLIAKGRRHSARTTTATCRLFEAYAPHR